MFGRLYWFVCQYIYIYKKRERERERIEGIIYDTFKK